MQEPSIRPSEDPEFLSQRKENGKPRFSTTILNRYMDRFHQIILESPTPPDFDQIRLAFPEFSSDTVRDRLKEYVSVRTDTIRDGLIIGLYPSADTVIDLAEEIVGTTRGDNLSEINQQCKKIVDKITKPRHDRFLSALLAEYRDDNGTNIIAQEDELIDLLYDEYAGYVSESGNSIASIAGTINEGILIRGLEASGLILGNHIHKPNKKRDNPESKYDLSIHGGSPPRALYCEIKSYKARERLLRGLADMRFPDKIAVGFFNDPTEFNPNRTNTLIQTRAAAIYLPDETFDMLPIESKSKTTFRQDSLYRPLSQFTADMVTFSRSGTLPAMPPPA